MPERRALAAEVLGTAFLLAAVVGSGIMAERLTHDVALALLANTFATACILFVLILMFAPLSGAHFNPAVTMAAALEGTLNIRTAALYIGAQIVGAVVGVILAHAMFADPLLALGVKVRTGPAQWLSEMVATFGLVLVIFGVRESNVESIAGAVALYIGAAYWFTASTSFANPAVTLARSFTPTFSGIRPEDAPAFIVAQFAGALLAAGVARPLFARRRADAARARPERLKTLPKA